MTTAYCEVDLLGVDCKLHTIEEGTKNLHSMTAMPSRDTVTTYRGDSVATNHCSVRVMTRTHENHEIITDILANDVDSSSVNVDFHSLCEFPRTTRFC